MSYAEALTAQRQEKDEFFRHDPYSPLTPQQQMRFTALNYFEPNPDLIFDLPVEKYPEQKHIRMLTSKGDIRSFIRWGGVTFTVEGQAAQLTLYTSPGQEGYFVPFMDATSGTETYGAGRYLDLEPLPEQRVHLDFNVAYSPYCAYNEPPEFAAEAGREPRLWSCPIPPKENRLTVAIRAGEKQPTGDWIAADHIPETDEAEG